MNDKRQETKKGEEEMTKHRCVGYTGKMELAIWKCMKCKGELQWGCMNNTKFGEIKDIKCLYCDKQKLSEAVTK